MLIQTSLIPGSYDITLVSMYNFFSAQTSHMNNVTPQTHILINIHTCRHLPATDDPICAEGISDVAPKHMLFVSSYFFFSTDPRHKKSHGYFGKLHTTQLLESPITFSIHYFKLNDSEKETSCGEKLVRRACPRRTAG